VALAAAPPHPRPGSAAHQRIEPPTRSKIDAAFQREAEPAMPISINIPKDQEQTLRNAWGKDLDQANREALAIAGYRSARLSAAEVGQLVGLEDRWAVNHWLASHRVPLN